MVRLIIANIINMVKGVLYIILQYIVIIHGLFRLLQ